LLFGFRSKGLIEIAWLGCRPMTTEQRNKPRTDPHASD